MNKRKIFNSFVITDSKLVFFNILPNNMTFNLFGHIFCQIDSNNLERESGIPYEAQHKLEKMWQLYILKSSQAVQDEAARNQALTELINERLAARYEATDHLWRSTSFDELDNYLDDGVLGKKGTDWDYTAATYNPKIAAEWDGQIVIEYKKDMIRNKKLVPYVLAPQPHTSIHALSSKYPETLGNPLDVYYYNESEVRLRDGQPILDPKTKEPIISRIFFPSQISGDPKTEAYIRKKYGPLADELIFNDFGHVLDDPFSELAAAAGKRDFDESKINIDKKGKFASKPGGSTNKETRKEMQKFIDASKYELTPKTIDQITALLPSLQETDIEPNTMSEFLGQKVLGVLNTVPEVERKLVKKLEIKISTTSGAFWRLDSNTLGFNPGFYLYEKTDEIIHHEFGHAVLSYHMNQNNMDYVNAFHEAISGGAEPPTKYAKQYLDYWQRYQIDYNFAANYIYEQLQADGATDAELKQYKIDGPTQEMHDRYNDILSRIYLQEAFAEAFAAIRSPADPDDIHSQESLDKLMDIITKLQKKYPMS